MLSYLFQFFVMPYFNVSMFSFDILNANKNGKGMFVLTSSLLLIALANKIK